MLNPCEASTECPHCHGRFTVHVLGVTVCPWCGKLIEIVLKKLEA
jgi:Zn finger protein HypA/HybF involved in hydrogenase expression